MTTIAKDSAVLFNYTLTDEEGTVIDQSPEGQPLAYLHGHANIIPGLESQLEGKSAGDKLQAVVAPADGYGEYHDQAVQEIPRENFQGVEDIQPGMQFQSQSGDQVMLVTVKDVNDEIVTVDANHPLAGKTLTFDVEITEVREATAEELSHGHVHGAGGVQH
ncbi:peptidylprolyl isomerase [Psychrobacter arenosus]|uniref:FKBP-type peptidyl-prolyl cis-trans isomerase n=1 Tax=Psychrobacter arenosus TaxID=256326 RepID=UPI00191B7C06|nr:peptidylprolyl isomerase [Psychrobacter arenosus]